MNNALRAEVRKMLTVRTTYYLMGFSLFLVLLLAGFITGYRVTHAQLLDPTYLSQQVLQAVDAVGFFAALVGVLLFANEYRHNTIIYTLTLSRSRSQVLAAKIIVASLFAMLTVLLLGIISPLVTLLGAHLHGYHFAPQTLHYGDLLWRTLFYAWGYAMFGLIIIALIRNQIAAIVTLLIAPGTLEGILSLLLKNNTRYLPFTALKNVPAVHPMFTGKPGFSALVVTTYIVVAWIIAWLLFLRRDAN